MGRSIAATVALVLASGLWVGCDDENAPLPTLAKVPDFQLTDQDGEPFDVSSLDDDVWIVGFVFTRCSTVCPVITAQMAGLQRRLGDDVQFVSVSVDPEHDTPAVLRAYAERYRVDQSRWRFLTGPRAKVREIVVDGFRLRMGEPETRDGRFDIMHASHLLLVDQTRHMRGYYPTDGEGLERLARDAKRLANH